MNITDYTHSAPIHIDGEKEMATKHFKIGIGDVWKIVATPMGIVVRRHRDNTGPQYPQLVDILLRDGGGFGIIEKELPQPAALKKGSK